MNQIIQNLKSGETLLEDVPVPRVGSGKVLIKTHRTLVSLGTEKMLVSFGQANLLDKARQQPERVKEVINKMKTDGVMPTVETVFRKLGTPLPLGYSQAGVVAEVGADVTEFKPGDRVVSNGNHAEYVAVPKNLVAKIPDGVSFEEASFTVVGAIGLQGIRLLQPSFGETVAVIGLGLIGLLSIQILKANGCNVVGFDLDEDKLRQAESYGITAVNSRKQDPVRFMEEYTNGVGTDAVLITASTKSNDVIKQSATMSRKRGRIVLVGVIGLELDRADFYEKELTFQVSCSYGPGRYDENYEQRGQDYPLAFVRWTEKRNFEAVLESIRNGSLDVKSLVTERVKLEDYLEIYGDMDGGKSIASILEYPEGGTTKGTKSTKDSGTTEITEGPESEFGTGKSTSTEKGLEELHSSNGKSDQQVSSLQRTITIPNATKIEGGKGVMAIVGAGNFTSSWILPAMKKSNAPVKYIVSSGGLSSTTLAKKYKIENSTTDLEQVLNDDDVEAVLITTRHNLHAGMTVQALNAGKHVFVEKPLAMNRDELQNIKKAVEDSGKTVTVGFNRRFSPHVQKIKSLVGDKPGAMNVIATMNAGFIPQDSWLQDMEVGGGRIIGEACHYVDLISYLTSSKVVSVSMQNMGKESDPGTDNAAMLLTYENGSLGVLNYFSNGHKSYSKEKVEVYYQGKNLVIDNFRTLHGYGFGGFRSRMLKTKQNKGRFKQFDLLAKMYAEGGEPIIPFDEIVNATEATLGAMESMQSGGLPVKIG